MLIKSATGRERDIETLKALMGARGVSPAVRDRIEQEIRYIRAGAKGESEAAYEIDFHHANSLNWAVIHDLRLEYQGRVAQIDHLLINRFLDMWVCESKHFSEGVSIDEQGEFSAWYEGRPRGIPSPIEQNRKHIVLLEALMGSSLLQLPTRIGFALRPNIKSVVLVSQRARITRPKSPLEGLEQVIKSDQLRAVIEKSVDQAAAPTALMSLTKVIGSDTLREFATKLARLHRPLTVDWAARFGILPMDPGTAPTVAVAGAAIVKAAEPKVAAQDRSRRDDPRTPTAAPPVAPATSAVGGEGDVHQGRLSTSKLAARHGIKSTQEMLRLLCERGYLVADGDGHALTAQGTAAGGRHVAKSRFGPYFLWPEDLPVRP